MSEFERIYKTGYIFETSKLVSQEKILVYSGKTMQISNSPKSQDVWITTPWDATIDPVPSYGANQIPQFIKDEEKSTDKENFGTWPIIDDFRNQTFYLKTDSGKMKAGDSVLVDYCGPLHTNLTAKPKPSDVYVWDEETNNWIKDLELVRADKIKDLWSYYEIYRDFDVKLKVTINSLEYEATLKAHNQGTTNAYFTLFPEGTSKVLEVSREGFDDEGIMLLCGSELKELNQEIVDRVQNNFHAASSHQRVLNKKTTVQAIEDHDYTLAVTWKGATYQIKTNSDDDILTQLFTQFTVVPDSDKDD